MERKLKIAYCIPGLYAPGGLERVLTLKANYLAEQLGYEVHIILTEEKDRKPYYELSPLIRVSHLDINFDRMHQTTFALRVIQYIYYQHIYKKRLRKKLYELRPDITISTLRREINFITSIKDGSAKVGEIHFSRENYRNLNDVKTLASVRRFISRLWMKQLLSRLRQLQKFVVLTHEDKEKWTELDNVMCIHNPTTFETDRHSSCGNKTVLAVGRYTYQKGFDLLLPAWKRVAEKHPDWKLQIFGDGDRSAYADQAKELDIASFCQLNGPTTRIAEKFVESSVFVLSSRYEGFGMVLTEAMACGVPVVSFACPCGPRDIITDGVDGLLTENGNIGQLADNLCRLIEDEELRKQMGRQAQENVKRFRMKHIASQWDQLFKSLVS